MKGAEHAEFELDGVGWRVSVRCPVGAVPDGEFNAEGLERMLVCCKKSKKGRTHHISLDPVDLWIRETNLCRI